MPTMGDVALVHRAQLGDQVATGRLVDRYRGAVFGLCLHLLGSVEDAQDATQDTFLQACQHLEQLRDPHAFPAWLARIARRECSRTGRGEARAAREPTPESPAPADPAERLERQRLVGQLRGNLALLPSDTRLIYLLSCLDGLTSRRIAAFLAMQPGAVRGRLHRARRRLAEALGADGTTERQRRAVSCSVPEVIPVLIGISCSHGPYPEAAFPDEASKTLYGYVYAGVPWEEALQRVGIPPEIGAACLRTWERYQVVEKTAEGLRPLVPVSLRTDRPGIHAWQQALARGWVEAALERRDRVAELARHAAPGGWEVSAREALCLWFPFSRLHHQLENRGLYLPPLARPSGACHLSGHESAGEDGGELPYGVGDSRSGDDDVMLAAIIWWHCKHSAEVGKFLDRGAPYNPLPRILLTFREDPPRRAAALQRVSEASDRYRSEGRQPNSADDLLDRLIGWRVVSAEEPHRLLLPAFVGDLARSSLDLAEGIAATVAARADESRGALEELIRTSSFAESNRSDVYRLVTVGLLFPALDGLIDAGLIPPFPDACFADRGPFIYEQGVLGL